MAWTTPARGAVTELYIFIASRVKRGSPFLTRCPTVTATREILPGMGAPTSLGSSGLALGRDFCSTTTLLSVTETVRETPLSSKLTARLPRRSGSATCTSLMNRVLPGSISAVISSSTLSP